MLEKIREALKKKEVETLKKSIDEYPHDGEMDYNVIKNMIASIPDSKFKDTDNEGKVVTLSEQEVIDMYYDSALQELINYIDCNVYYDEKKIRFTRKMFEDFLKCNLDTDKLQKQNVLLTTDLWFKALLSPKTTINYGYFKRIVDFNKHRINYTELSTCNKNHQRRLPVITTIQFDNDCNPDETLSAEELTIKAREKFEDLFCKLADSNDINIIVETANHVRDFSIHKYYAPAGIDEKAMEKCSLLLRYDHCSLKHYNGAMPKLYKKVYPAFVEEPHFHFNSGFGSIYGLDKSNQVHTFGVGYAIGLTALKEYLEKLNNETFEDEKERKLYLCNNFGMPFLHFKMLDIENQTSYLDKILENLTLLIFNENVASNDQVLKTAYDFINMISITKKKDLSYHHNNSVREERQNGRGKR